MSHLRIFALLFAMTLVSFCAAAQEEETVAVEVASVAASDEPVVLAQYDFVRDYADSGGKKLGFKAVNAPVEDGALQLNGLYESEDGGFTAATANIDTLSYELFSVNLDFQVAPERGKTRDRMPIIVGGVAYRWLGVYVTDENRVGVFLNNGKDRFPTELTIQPGRWYTLHLTFDYTARTFTLTLDGKTETVVSLPDDLELQVITDGMDRDKNFTFTDYSRGIAMRGAVRNLVIEGYAPPAEQ